MLSGYVIFVGLFAIAMSIASFWRPGYAWSLVATSYVFEQLLQTQIAFFTANKSFVNITVALVVILALLFSKGASALYTAREPMIVLFVVFAILVFCSSLWSLDEDLAFKHLQESLPYFVLFAFLAPRTLETEADLRDAIVSLLVFSTLLCIGMIFSSVDAEQQRWTVLKFEERGDFSGNPLEVGSTGARLAVVALLFIPFRKSLLWKVAMIGIGLLGIAVAIKSGSRGQVLAVPFAVVITFFSSRKAQSFVNILVGGFAFGLATWLVLLFIEAYGFTSRFSTTKIAESIVDERLDFSILLLERYVAGGPLDWIIGLGAESSYSIIGSYPHIVILQVLAEQGVAGSMLFLAILALALRSSWQKMRRQDAPIQTGIWHEVLFGLLLLEIFLMSKQGATLGASLYLLPLSMGRFYASSTIARESQKIGTANWPERADRLIATKSSS